MPLIAAEGEVGYSSEITRHGKPVAMVVPVRQWQAQQTRTVKMNGILALRGTGAGLWPRGASSAGRCNGRAVAGAIPFEVARCGAIGLGLGHRCGGFGYPCQGFFRSAGFSGVDWRNGLKA